MLRVKLLLGLVPRYAVSAVFPCLVYDVRGVVSCDFIMKRRSVRTWADSTRATEALEMELLCYGRTLLPG